MRKPLARNKDGTFRRRRRNPSKDPLWAKWEHEDAQMRKYDRLVRSTKDERTQRKYATLLVKHAEEASKIMRHLTSLPVTRFRYR